MPNGSKMDEVNENDFLAMPNRIKFVQFVQLVVKKCKNMKVDKSTWQRIIQLVVSILTAALTALGTTSCMGRGPF